MAKKKTDRVQRMQRLGARFERMKTAIQGIDTLVVGFMDHRINELEAFEEQLAPLCTPGDEADVEGETLQ